MATSDTENPTPVEHTRTGMTCKHLRQAFLDNLFYLQGRPLESATRHDQYMALSYTVRDRLLERWLRSANTYKERQARTVCYLSAEFLLGPHLENNLSNLCILETTREAMATLGLDLDEILEEEEEPGLGNGGLGRLAACFMDALATRAIPAIGHGIRYEYGIFDQEIRNGWQVEITDQWLRNGNPWEMPRPKLRMPVWFGGHTEQYHDDQGRLRVRWHPALVINGVPYDTPILGFGVDNTNLLRLWRAEAAESFDFGSFNKGDYYGAVHAKTEAENISKVLYPNDEQIGGKELRLKQQYFFVSCALRDMIRLYLQTSPSLHGFEQKYAAQLNDTHPAIAVAELMRLALDEHGLDWDAAWHLTRNTFAYTNHTLLPEALETWPVELFGRVLPRHLEIIYEINQRFLDEMRVRYPWDAERIARLSIIGEEGGKRVRMANLATIGSHAVNGVAAMHSELVKHQLLRDFHDLWPEQFHNVTNGVSPRRFVQQANPGLDAILTEVAGPAWPRDLRTLRQLEAHADDSAFQERWAQMKAEAKARFGQQIEQRLGIKVDPHSLFDVQAKRIHEYKRPHLNLLHIVSLYNRIKQNPNGDYIPRTFIFGGKAAPGYRMAKLIIKLIHSVAEVVNHDKQINGWLRVVFYPDFNVKNAQPIYPAADLSEQISTAGKEASGTGNMKFSLNGALTIGTLDGANVEIRDAVGAENFFLFGHTEGQVAQLLAEGYHPWEYYHGHTELREAIDLIATSLFSHGDGELFRPLLDNLLQHDPYLLLADFPSYLNAQEAVARAFTEPHHWRRMSILNTARMGYFSADRSVVDYNNQIWHAEPVVVGTPKG